MRVWVACTAGLPALASCFLQTFISNTQKEHPERTCLSLPCLPSCQEILCTKRHSSFSLDAHCDQVQGVGCVGMSRTVLARWGFVTFENLHIPPLERDFIGNPNEGTPNREPKNMLET